MKKLILIAPRCHVREVPEPDAERLLATGSWVRASVAQTRKPSSRAVRQFKQRRREQGYRVLHALLPAAVMAALHAEQRPGETLAELIARRLLGNADDEG